MVGIVATVAARLLIREEAIVQHRAARTLFTLVVLTLPTALGVWYSVYREGLKPTSPYSSSSLGYTFDIPRASWAFLPAERDDVADESIVFMNWTAFAPDGPVPKWRPESANRAERG